MVFFLPFPHILPRTAQSGRSHPIPSSLPWNGRKRVDLLATFWFFWGLPEGLVSVLPDSVLMGTAASFGYQVGSCRNRWLVPLNGRCSESTELQEPDGKKLWAEEYNNTASKSVRSSETFR